MGYADGSASKLEHAMGLIEGPRGKQIPDCGVFVVFYRECEGPLEGFIFCRMTIVAPSYLANSCMVRR